LGQAQWAVADGDQRADRYQGSLTKSRLVGLPRRQVYRAAAQLCISLEFDLRRNCSSLLCLDYKGLLS
jgi:hypothetical protein